MCSKPLDRVAKNCWGQDMNFNVELSLVLSVVLYQARKFCYNDVYIPSYIPIIQYSLPKTIGWLVFELQRV